jgi:L,D-transpeptidase catalytic domain
MMFLPVRDSRRLTIRAATVALLATLAIALPATARAADGPRFLLVAAPHGAVVHARPRGPAIATLSGSTPLGSPTWLWVTATTPGGRWGRVVLPIKPNGLAGWIDLHGLAVARTRTWIRASLNERTLWLMRGARPLAAYPAAIGAAGTPTPVGRFSVTDRVLTGDPSGPFGWYAFGLSGHQPHLPPGWAGGDQLAIHGTNDPASIGTPASHGCLRVAASALTRLRAALALGTPVVIMPSRAAAMRSAIAASLPRLHVRNRHALHRHPPAATVPPTLFELQPPSAPMMLARTLAGSVAPRDETMPPAVRPRPDDAPMRPPAARLPRADATLRRFVTRSPRLRPVPGAGRSPPRAPPRYPGSGRSE